METQAHKETRPPKRSLKGWIRKIGIAGLIFFTIKGLLWLLIPYLIAVYFSG